MVTVEQTSLRLALPRLPDFAAVGGNARHAHWQERADAIKAESDAWIMLMLHEGYRPASPEPAISGPATARYTMHFKGVARPDMLNAAYALKCLEDLLQRPAYTKDGRVTGYLGWVRNDSQFGWRTTYCKVEHSADAPMTVVEVWTAREAA